jgi:hypothetical protein
MNWEVCGRKRPLTILRYDSGISLERLSNFKIMLSWGSRYQGPNLKKDSPEYKSGLPTILLWTFAPCVTIYLLSCGVNCMHESEETANLCVRRSQKQTICVFVEVRNRRLDLSIMEASVGPLKLIESELVTCLE